MNRLSKFLILFAFMVPTLAAQSQSDTKTMMDRVSKKLQSFTSLKADFSFTLSNTQEKIDDTRDGSLLLSGSRYRLNIMGILALCDGKTLWTVNDELKEANIIDPEDNEMFNPKSIFTIYEKNFRYETVGSAGDKVTVDMFPLGQDESYSKIRMDILKSKDQIDKVIYFSKDDNQYIIKIKNFAGNVPVEDKMFVYDPKDFPGIKLFDMR